MIMRLRRLRNPEKRRVGMEHITSCADQFAKAIDQALGQ